MYADADPGSSVKYALLDSYQDANAYTGTASTVLSFIQVGSSNWWYAEITISNTGWTAFTNIKSNSTSDSASSTIADTGTGTKASSTLTNSIANNKTYYYNAWSADEAQFDTLLVLQWSGDAKLGPITKSGDTITITNGDATMGTLSAQNIFGESISVGVAVSTPHAPIYINAQAAEGYAFGGFSGAATSVVAEGVYRYDFTKTASLTGTWAKKEILPGITASVLGNVVSSMDFFAATEGMASFSRSQATVFTLTADFSRADDLSSLTYTITGDTTGSGELTAADPSVDVTAAWNDTVITFTAVSTSGQSYTITFTAKAGAASGLSPVASIGSTLYYYLEDALVAAQSGDTIVVLRNCSFYKGEKNPEWTNGNAGYTIDSGVTLLLPYDQGKTTVDTTTATNELSSTLIYANKTLTTTSTGYLEPQTSLYLTMTIPEGIDLSVANGGKLVVGGTLCGTTYYACVTAGSHSNIQAEGTITVKSGGILSCCGYILGNGQVIAESGANIYQPFSILDYRGGGYTTSTNSSSGVKSGESAIAPFVRYTTQNIQADLHMGSGAKMYGYCDLYTSATSALNGMVNIPAQHNVTVPLIIGGASDSALFMLADGAKLDASYDGTSVVSPYNKIGKTTVIINGGATMGTLELTVSVGGTTQNVSTSGVTFPLPYNYEFHLGGANSTYTLGYSLGVLPGATLHVGEGAALNVSGSSTRLMVYDGLNDHPYKFAGESPVSVAYNGGVQSSNVYPNTKNLQSAGSTGTGNLIVSGTVNIGSGVKIGGIVQADGNQAKLVMDSGATASCATQMGLVGKVRVLKTYYCAGATVRTLNAQIIDTGTGKRTNIQSGLTYSSAKGSDVLPYYTYTLYTDDSETSEDHKENLNAVVDGSWYNYEVTVHMVLSDGTEVGSLKMRFAHNADVTGLGYYSDSACTSAVNTITNANDLYCNNIEARVEWANNAPDTYYPSLRNAVKDAVNPGDRVVLMRDITLDTSIPIDSAQNITITLKDGSTAHSIAYTATPFINSGKLTLDLGGGTITNLAGGTYTEAPAITNSAEGNLTLRTNGGAISMIYSSKTNATYAAAVTNYGTLTVDGTGGGSIIAKNLETVEIGYATTAAIAKQGVGAYDASYPSTVNSRLDYLCGIYNTGTIADITGTAEIFGAYYGIYNGNGNTATDARIDRISSGSIRSDYIALYNYYASIGNIAGGSFSVTDLAFFIPASWGTCRADVLYNYGGSIDEITGGTFFIEDTARRTATLTFYSYNTATSNYTHYYSPGYALYTWSNHSNGSRATIGTIGAAKLHSEYSYAIYNYGGRIGIMDGAAIDGRYGIMNRNTRIYDYNNQTYGSTVGMLGVIDVIRNVNIDVNRYGIYNGGIINEISGTSIIKATPDSAQDDTPGSAIDGNVQGYAIFNSNGWYVDTALQKRTDNTSSGVLVRTDVYDTVNKPTIGKITGDVTVTAINTSTNVDHGMALYNAGLINEISGNATFQTSVHPSNTKITYSRYAINNTAGGIIGAISGNVTLSAGGYALYNGSYITERSVTTYTTTSASVAKHVETTYVPSRIGNITGDVSSKGITIEATASTYGIINYSTIGDITGKVTITANKSSYCVRNMGDSAYTAYEFVWAEDGAGNVKTYDYTRTISSIGTIGGGDSEILISSLNGYTLENNGDITAILDGVTIQSLTGSTSSNNNYAALLNTESGQIMYSYTITNLGANGVNSGRYDTKYERAYTYRDTGGHIGAIEGDVKITTAGYYALSNLGTIDRIGPGVQLEAGKNYALYNTHFYTGTRHTIQYYYGTSAFATSTPYFSEQPLDYTRSSASIGVIDGVTITAAAYGVSNGGHIGSIVNSTITTTGERAISNTSTTTTSYVNNMGDAFITYDDSTGKYALATVSDSVTQREGGTIGLIGGGNTISGTTNVVINSGGITTIDNTDAMDNVLTNSTITATAGVALYNYRGITAKETKVSGSASYVYGSAAIGTVKNIQITGTTYAIQNGDGSATYPNVTIGELGDGLIATAKNASGYAVYNADANASITRISGGDYKGGAESLNRAYAIRNPDSQTYPEGYTLSGAGVTRSVTLADGTTGSGYYFITPTRFVIHFNGSGADGGSMTDLVVYLPVSGNITLPDNGFTKTGVGGEAMTFAGWAAAAGKADADLENGWSGTTEQLKSKLGLDALGAGSEITLYAVWQDSAAISVTISWGELSYIYTPTVYTWNGELGKYETNADAGWALDTSSDENAGKITITNNSSAKSITAALTFARETGMDQLHLQLKNSGTTATDTLDISSPITPGASQPVEAMLSGKPGTLKGSTPVKVGTVTVTINSAN